MSISNWHIGQKVTVHFPNANQGDARFKNTTVTKVGRKYISVAGMAHDFDAADDPPRDTNVELYTPEGYIEMVYIKNVLQAFDRHRHTKKWPTALMLLIGDHLGVTRPNHLRDDLDQHLLDIIQKNI